MEGSAKTDAVRALETMFPSLDRDVIETVLESKNMDQTAAVDALLQIANNEDSKQSTDSSVSSSAKAAVNASEGKKARQQLHEDELLAQALQSELSKSSDGVVDESQLAKRVKQMELDEALAASLAYKEQQREIESQRIARENVRKRKTTEVPMRASEEDSEDDESSDIFEEIAEGFDKTIDDMSKKADEFADDVASAWTSLTRRISQTYNETFNSANESRSPDPRLIVRTQEDDEVGKPLLDDD